MLTIIDYGLGNLYSLSHSLSFIGVENRVSGDPGEIARAQKLILPGVGAFEDAANRLRRTGLDALIRARAAEGTPLLGICLGMQLLFEESFEYGRHAGLGLIEGQVCPIARDLDRPLKVPHIGWNSLKFHRAGRLTSHIQPGDFVYFVHSYYVKGCGRALVASAEYGVEVPAIVEADNVMGTQFHPEKSGGVGLSILRAFAEM